MEMISSPEVVFGWHEHHAKMLQDQKFLASFEAWHNMDRQLCTQLIDNPFVVDPTCTTYTQLFEWSRMDVFLEHAEKSQQHQHLHSHNLFRGG